MKEFVQAVKLYMFEFGEPFPTMELRHLPIEEQIQMIYKCLKEDKPIEKYIKIKYNGKRY